MNVVKQYEGLARRKGEEERGRPWRRRMRLLAASVLVVAAVGASPPLTAAARPSSPPDVPTEISVPAGHVLTNLGRARGFQIYTCRSTENGFAWVLLQPMAVLLEEGHKPFALHYGGPSWTAMDGSTVVAARVAGAPAPSGTTIPWLLLGATSTTGPVGGTFTSTTYIRRVNTEGGLAPTGGCDAAHVGASAPVYYTADYYFYRAG